MIRRVLPVLLLLAWATAAGAAEDAGELVKQLGSADWKVKVAAYRALVSRRDPAALPHLRRALPTYDHTGQLYGVLVLDRYPLRQARRTWRALLQAESPYLRVCAGTALLRGRDESVLEAMAEALVAPGVEPIVRVRMLGRLGWRIHPRLLPSLRALLAPGQDVTVLTTTITQLHRLQDRGAVPQLQGLLGDPRPGARALAAALLYDLGHMARAKELAASLRKGIPYAEFALVAAILSPQRRVVDEILDAVVARLAEETNPTLLVQQAEFLGRHQYRKARPALRKLLAHPNRTVARGAFDVLVTISGPLREDTLRPLLGGDDVGRRLWAAEALRQRDDPSGIAAVIYALQSGTLPERKAAVRILASYTMDMAVEPLLDALEDEHPEIRAAALAGVQRLLARLFPYRSIHVALTGYAPNADAAKRAAAVEQVRAWWRANRGADW